MIITPSRWQMYKYKDLFHFYLMLGVIPLSLLVFFINIYIGPAQLAEIPEGYHPEKWEYYKVSKGGEYFVLLVIKKVC